jgi:hypothetical protein
MAQGRLVTLMSAGVPDRLYDRGIAGKPACVRFRLTDDRVVGGVLPLAMVPLLALRLPESVALRAATRRHNLVVALFQNGLAPSTVLLWGSICSVCSAFHPVVDAGHLAQHRRDAPATAVEPEQATPGVRANGLSEDPAEFGQAAAFEALSERHSPRDERRSTLFGDGGPDKEAYGIMVERSGLRRSLTLPRPRAPPSPKFVPPRLPQASSNDRRRRKSSPGGD